MDPITLLVIAAAVGVFLYAVFGKDNLASSIRALFAGTKSKLTGMIDNAVNQIEAAVAQTETRLAKANKALVDIKGSRKNHERKLDNAKREVEKYQIHADNAASVGKKDLVKGALEAKNKAQVIVDQLEPTYNLLVAKEGEVQAAVNALNTERASLIEKRATFKARASAAQTAIDVNQLLSQVLASGESGHAKRADELIHELESKAWATAEVANATSSQEDLDAQLEALTNQTDVDAEADALMAKYAQKVDRLSTPEVQKSFDNYVAENASLTDNEN